MPRVMMMKKIKVKAKVNQVNIKKRKNKKIREILEEVLKRKLQM